MFEKLIEAARTCYASGNPIDECCLKGCPNFDSQPYCLDQILKDCAEALTESSAQLADKDYLIQQQTEEIQRLQRDVKKQQEKMIEMACKLPKRGEWKKISNRDDGTADYECSACHGIIIDVPNDDERPLVSYCPMCGASMTVAARCKHMDKNGFCLIISDSEVREYCVDGPCRFYEEVPDDRK